MAVPWHVADAAVAPNPFAREDLHEAHAAFHKPPGEQALAGERAAVWQVESVRLARRLGFFRQIHRLGRRHLHAVGQFEGVDPRGQVALRRPFARMPLV